MVKETLAAETCILVNCKITPFTPLILFFNTVLNLKFQLVFFVLTPDHLLALYLKNRNHTPAQIGAFQAVVSI